MHEANGLGRRRRDMEGRFRGCCGDAWRESDPRVVAVETDRSG